MELTSASRYGDWSAVSLGFTAMEVPVPPVGWPILEAAKSLSAAGIRGFWGHGDGVLGED